MIRATTNLFYITVLQRKCHISLILNLKGMALGVGLTLPLENIAAFGRKILMKRAEFGFSWGMKNKTENYT